MTYDNGSQSTLSVVENIFGIYSFFILFNLLLISSLHQLLTAIRNESSFWNSAYGIKRGFIPKNYEIDRGGLNSVHGPQCANPRYKSNDRKIKRDKIELKKGLT